jgi:hypothetical protein
MVASILDSLPLPTLEIPLIFDETNMLYLQPYAQAILFLHVFNPVLPYAIDASTNIELDVAYA